MAVRHSDRHLDPHGHRHGPRRDELHGSRVATAKYGAYSKKKFPPLRRESRRGNDFLDDCFLDYLLGGAGMSIWVRSTLSYEDCQIRLRESGKFLSIGVALPRKPFGWMLVLVNLLFHFFFLTSQ